jgi:hypothetical protein
MRNEVTLLAAAAVFIGLASGAASAQQQGGGAGAGAGAGSGVVGGGLLVGRGRATGPAKPAPRNAAGRIVLGGSTPDEKGVWLPGPGITAVAIKPPETVPFQPWAKQVFTERQIHELEPHTRCKASGVARPFQTPYGVEFVELPEFERIFIFDIGGPHTVRTVYMDGRTHPANFLRTSYGHSIGWWDGDTLVVDSTGFNENFWLDRKGLPHTEKLRTVEKWTRTDFNTLRYGITVDDPGAYTSPWTTEVMLRWEAGTELFEYVCQQANYAHHLMLGEYQTVDRTTVTVP